MTLKDGTKTQVVAVEKKTPAVTTETRLAQLEMTVIETMMSRSCSKEERPSASNRLLWQTNARES
jgi:hypothetical protein